MRLTCILPSRGRPEKLRAAIANHLNTAGSSLTQLVVGIDADDPLFGENMVVMRGFDDPRLRLKVLPAGLGKIKAINATVPHPDSFDVLVVSSDDMEVQSGHLPTGGNVVVDIMQKIFPLLWDDTVAHYMEFHFPALNGALHFHDGNQQRVMTWPVIGRRLYETIGGVYDPSYITECADDELHIIAARLGALAKIDESVRIVKHLHPAYHDVEMDETYTRNLKTTDRILDRVTYENRLARNFDRSPVLLSILIPTIEGRETQLRRLLDGVDAQLCCVPRQLAQIACVRHVPNDRGGPTMGWVRNRMVREAVGTYAMFVDDDDVLAPDAIARIMLALRRTDAATHAECTVGYRDARHPEASFDRLYHHSTDYPEWTNFAQPNERAMSGVRTPNHINAIRTDILREVWFDESMNKGEDHDFSKRVLPKLTVEAKIEDWWRPTYLYDFDPATTRAQKQ